MRKGLLAAAFFVGTGILLAGCSDDPSGLIALRSAAPVPEKTVSLMSEKNMARNAPILIRSYKKESELEIWKQTRNGDFALLKTYPICRWSGQLGPKTREGDRQAPEGFYSITPASLNPNSQLYLSFDMNYPNAYDRSLGRTGAFLMVHGACSSAGCYSMSDEQMVEIYALLRESFAAGQSIVQMQAMPFRMTPENLAKHRLDQNLAFWRNLKEGADRFEITKRPPAVAVCGKRYVFDAKPKDPAARVDPMSACPEFEGDASMAMALTEKSKADEAAVTSLVAAGTPAVKVVYQDGSQHPSFRTALETGSMSPSRLYGASNRAYHNISRPEALRTTPQEIVMDPAPKATAVAAAKPAEAKPASVVRVAGAPASSGPAVGTPAAGAIAPAGANTVAIAAAKPQAGPAQSQPAVAVASAAPGAVRPVNGTTVQPLAAPARPVLAAATVVAPTPRPGAIQPAPSAPAQTATVPAPAKPAASPSIYDRVLAFTGFGSSKP